MEKILWLTAKKLTGAKIFHKKEQQTATMFMAVAHPGFQFIQTNAWITPHFKNSIAEKSTNLSRDMVTLQPKIFNAKTDAGTEPAKKEMLQFAETVFAPILKM